MPDCDASTFDRLIGGLETAGGQNGMDEDAGYDVHTLNAEMIEMLRRDCEKTAEKIETDENARWMEEHKKFMTILADSVTEFAYGVAIYHSMTAKKQYLERSERQKNYNATEEPTNANQQIRSGAGGTEGGTGTVDDFINNNVNPNFQQNVKDAFLNDAKVTVLEQDITVYRYHGGSSQGTSYWYTPNQTSNPATDLALPQGNTYQYMDTFVIPKGTTLLEGTVAPNFGQPGGGYQFYVPDPSVVIKQ